MLATEPTLKTTDEKMKRGMKMMTLEKTNYINISEKYGDPVAVTVDDYKKMNEIYGEQLDVTIDENGIYVDGEQVAVTAAEYETM